MEIRDLETAARKIVGRKSGEGPPMGRIVD